MEQLLRDGGDLDSMDRSLLDYGAMRNAQVKNGQPMSPTGGATLPPPPSGVVNASPCTPPVSPASPCEDLSASNGNSSLIKKDLVVRFTEQQNCVASVTSSSAGGAATAAAARLCQDRRFSDDVSSTNEMASEGKADFVCRLSLVLAFRIAWQGFVF